MAVITSDHYRLYGFLMSPYSMKMRSYLRYRRIPFEWQTGEVANTIAMTKVDPYMVPVLEYPDGSFAHDSTYLIADLEQRYPERGTTPEDEADAFLAALIEDYADEWLLGPFFLYRWESEEDQQHNSEWIIYEYFRGDIGHDQFRSMAEMWQSRQTKLLPSVSGMPESYEMSKTSLEELLNITEQAFRNRPFFFGSRPTSAEFALFGMFSQLLQDLTANQMMRKHYPFTSRWVGMMDDLSGFEGSWETVSGNTEALTASPIFELLKLSGRYHLPMLTANQAAMEKRQKTYTIEVSGIQYERKTLPRFLPCLPALQDHYNALSESAKKTLYTPLTETGCLPFLVRQS